jgi:uncharacterized protein YchJ
MRESTPEEVKRQIAQADPSISKLSDWVPQTRGELYAFIAIVLTIISLALQSRSNSDVQNQSTTINVHTVINNIEAEDDARQPYIRTDPKVGRNQLCPCGSGKKFKRCHGR